MEKMEWRAPMQDAKLWRILAPVGIVLNAAGIAAMGATVFEEYRVIGIVCCVAVAAVTIAMYLRFPQYYTLLEKKEYKKAGLTAPVRQLGLALACPALGLALQARNFHISGAGWTWLIVLTLILGAAVFALLYFRAREVREQESAFCLALVVALALGFGVVVNGNHHLNFSAEPPQEYTVISTRHTSRRKSADSYSCVIELEPGKEVRIPLTYDQYMALGEGDTVEVFYGPGAFGVKYAYFVGIGGNTDG